MVLTHLFVTLIGILTILQYKIPLKKWEIETKKMLLFPLLGVLKLLKSPHIPKNELWFAVMAQQRSNMPLASMDAQ